MPPNRPTCSSRGSSTAGSTIHSAYYPPTIPRPPLTAASGPHVQPCIRPPASGVRRATSGGVSGGRSQWASSRSSRFGSVVRRRWEVRPSRTSRSWSVSRTGGPPEREHWKSGGAKTGETTTGGRRLVSGAVLCRSVSGAVLCRSSTVSSVGEAPTLPLIGTPVCLDRGIPNGENTRGSELEEPVGSPR